MGGEGVFGLRALRGRRPGLMLRLRRKNRPNLRPLSALRYRANQTGMPAVVGNIIIHYAK